MPEEFKSQPPLPSQSEKDSSNTTAGPESECGYVVSVGGGDIPFLVAVATAVARFISQKNWLTFPEQKHSSTSSSASPFERPGQASKQQLISVVPDHHNHPWNERNKMTGQWRTDNKTTQFSSSLVPCTPPCVPLVC